MKITYLETTIEANAAELQASRTLADGLTSLLSRCFNPMTYAVPVDDSDDEKGDSDGKSDKG